MDSKVKSGRVRKTEKMKQNGYDAREAQLQKALEEKPPRSPKPHRIKPISDAKRKDISDLLDLPDRSASPAIDQDGCATLGEGVMDTTTLVAQESRRERYTKMLETRWGTDWSLVLCKAKIISKRRSDRGISVTVTKHLAIMAYWVWDILEAIELLRVSITGRKSGASERNRAAHVTANDVKSVLGAREDLDKKTWDDLADEALRGIEE